MNQTGDSLKSGIPCQCGRWSHQAARGFAVVGMSGPVTFFRADESHCPKCRAHYLLLWHVTHAPRVTVVVRPVGLTPLPRGEKGFRRALSMIREEHPHEDGLTEDVIDSIVASAQAWAGEVEPAA